MILNNRYYQLIWCFVRKNLVKKLLVAVLLVLVTAIFAFNSPALASDDLAIGKKIFDGNCAPCHTGGRNVVNGSKTLQKSDLKKYKMDSVAAIKQQVTYGKNAMPAFGGRLSSQYIEDVAKYVISQSKKGW
jgi:cytochrome c6